MNFKKPTVLNTVTDLFYISTLFSHCYKQNNSHDFLITTDNFEKCLNFFYLNTSANLILMDGKTKHENIYIINSVTDESPGKFNIFITSNQSFVDMKDFFLSHSYDVVSFISKLLVKNPLKRGSLSTLIDHEFFKGINFADIKEKKVTPSFVPKQISTEKPLYFDKVFTQEEPQDSVATPQDYFSGFEYNCNFVNSFIIPEI